MPDCENIEMQYLRRMQELQHENERLVAQLEEIKAAADRRMFSIAEMEEKCRELSAKLNTANESERWIRREYETLAAQMEIVHLIFGGRQGGGCGGCH